MLLPICAAWRANSDLRGRESPLAAAFSESLRRERLCAPTLLAFCRRCACARTDLNSDVRSCIDATAMAIIVARAEQAATQRGTGFCLELRGQRSSRRLDSSLHCRVGAFGSDHSVSASRLDGRTLFQADAFREIGDRGEAARRRQDVSGITYVPNREGHARGKGVFEGL